MTMSELEYIEIELDRLSNKITALEQTLISYKKRLQVPNQDRIEVCQGAIRHNQAKVVALVKIREIVIANLKEPTK
jgi:hypothetical protein